MGENANTVRVGVERAQGLGYDVTVGYRARMMSLTTTDAGVTIYPALEGEDYVGKQGTLVFRQRSQVTHSLVTPTANSNRHR